MITSRTILCFLTFLFPSVLILFFQRLEVFGRLTSYRFDGDSKKAGYFQ